MNDNLYQSLHERIETLVVDHGVLVLNFTSHRADFRFQYTLLRAPSTRMVISWVGKPTIQQIVDIFLRRLHQHFHVLVLFLFVVFLFFPILYVLTVPNEDVEVGIQHQNSLTFHLLFLQTNRRRPRFLDCVRKKSRLNNSDAMLHSFNVQSVSVIGELVAGKPGPAHHGVPPKVVKELREVLHFLTESKRLAIPFAILGKIQSPSYEQFVQPKP